MRLQAFIPLFALTFILSASTQDQPGGGRWEMVKDIPPADYCDLHWIDAKRAYVVGTLLSCSLAITLRIDYKQRDFDQRCAR